jgi:hypothetical protein
VLGGMLAATVLAVVFVPLFYLWLAGPGEPQGASDAGGEPPAEKRRGAEEETLPGFVETATVAAGEGQES